MMDNSVTNLTLIKLLPNIDEMTLEELKTLKEDLQNIINSKQKKRTVYTHDCMGSSSYHFVKYKHYAKLIKSIDDSKDNGYAFVGDFLPVNQETLIPDCSYVVEACSEKLQLYLIKNDEKELLLTGIKKSMVSFIREAKEITNL